MALSHDPGLWRLQAARALAWALLLGGWVGLGGLAQALAASPLLAFALLALWLLALGGFAELIARLSLPRWLLRALLIAAALLAARALHLALHGGGLVALLPAVLAWAFVVALASAAVRACRQALRVRAGLPVAAAVTGALLAWWCVGDISDTNTLGPRLAWAALAASVLLAALLPLRSGTAGVCRAGLFDCSLPRWSAADWRLPERRPAMLASLAMLPMMCSLPLMVSLCRSDAASPQLVLGLHFAAMFVPAWLAARHPALLRMAPGACAALLAIGALALLFAPGASAWWALALAHGAAWSLAWISQLQLRGAPTAAHGSVLAGAALNAALVLVLGIGLAIDGMQTLTAWHVALGLAAGLVWIGRQTRQWRARAADT